MMTTPKRSLSPSDEALNQPEPKRSRLDSAEDKTPEGKTPEDKAPEDKTPNDKVPDDKTPEDNTPDFEIIEVKSVKKVEAATPVKDEVPELKETPAIKSLLPTQHSNARTGLQRSIAMVLKHDGFDSASPEAMESFTEMVETYMESLLNEAKSLALSARREHPVPTDFDHSLRHHNLSIASLKPHIRHPVPKHRTIPEYSNIVIQDEDAYTTLPLLGEELSGQPDKEEKIYIPSSFPDFPSKHTYKFTPQEDNKARDSKRIREEAARTAQQGEDALRRLVRASKMRKQKEVKSLVERDPNGKERFRLWELTMKRFMVTDGSVEHTDATEIADHSMIVNGEAMFSRKEVPRFGKRAAGMMGNKKSS